ncbi:hypothetical protein [Chelativorans sp. M5D2P16]|uniref:hypothetical protein n=1 Tax=Chelativorans sp. M5D2P16 TaxID=3095678 RepID=UPI002ACAC063|nr:hypothetical protein [Chelativorans sp. M5D2P16]MDZ5699850.1 hypothetical protein [Chelativorans sp. M5D2P16]
MDGRQLRDHIAVDLLHQPSADEIARIANQLNADASGGPEREPAMFLACIERATIAPGQIDITLAADAVAGILGVPATTLNAERLRLAASFQFRKRGVETKLVIGRAATKAVDKTLIRNIARAHRCYDAIRQGRTIYEIAAAENTSKPRILQLIDLAFLAPDIVQAIILGDQPVGLTSQWLQRNALPPDWQVQRRLIATL